MNWPNRLSLIRIASVPVLTALLVFSNPNNPTGRILEKDELERIGQLSEKYGLYRQNYCGCIYSKR